MRVKWRSIGSCIAIVVTAIASGCDSHPGSEIQARNEVRKPATIPAPEQFTELMARVQTGNPSEAAEALIQALPNGETLSAYYGPALEAVKASSGEIDIALLQTKSDRRGYIFETLESTRDRRLAVLWWTSVKLWEMPTGDEKQALFNRHWTSLDVLVSEGHIKPGAGLKVAWDAAFQGPVLPDVALSVLAMQFRRNLDSPDPEAKAFANARMAELMECLEEGEQQRLYEFLKSRSPERRFPQHVHQFLYGTGTSPMRGFISRKEYDLLPSLTLQELYEKLKEEGRVWQDGSRCDSFFCDYALSHIISAYPESPEEVKNMVKSLLDDGYYLFLIDNYVNDPSGGRGTISPDKVGKYEPLMEFIKSHPRYMEWDARWRRN